MPGSWPGCRGQRPRQPIGISRVLAGLYAHRARPPPGLSGFHGASRQGYLDWVRETGMAEMRLPESVAPPSRPPPMAGAGAPAGPAWPVQPLRGVNVVGYFRSESGLGEAARQVVSALDAAGVLLLPCMGGRSRPTARAMRSPTLTPRTRGSRST